MLIIPTKEINGQEVEFGYTFDVDQPRTLHVRAYGGDKQCEFSLENIQLLTVCAIIELAHKKAEECLQ